MSHSSENLAKYPTPHITPLWVLSLLHSYLYRELLLLISLQVNVITAILLGTNATLDS